MSIREAKVYNDGGHWIAIVQRKRPGGARTINVEKEIYVNEKNEIISENEEGESTITMPNGVVLEEIDFECKELDKEEKIVKPRGRKTTRKAIFEEAYKESFGMSKKERKKYIMEQIKGLFKTKKEAEEFCNANLERKHKNLSTRWLRMRRKANLQEFNYFCTFTYDDKLHTEESFKKKFKNCLSHLSNRKGWKYIGVWERSPEKKRLHFHGVFYIPEGAMVGEFKEIKDFNVNKKKMQIANQNTFINKK